MPKTRTKARRDSARAIRLAEGVLKKLEVYVENGLPDVYDSVQDWLYDFYPDLPWNNTRVYSLEWLTTDARAIEIINRFSQKVDFDMMTELKETLAEDTLNERVG